MKAYIFIFITIPFCTSADNDSFELESSPKIEILNLISSAPNLHQAVVNLRQYMLRNFHLKIEENKSLSAILEHLSFGALNIQTEKMDGIFLNNQSEEDIKYAVISSAVELINSKAEYYINAISTSGKPIDNKTKDQMMIELIEEIKEKLQIFIKSFYLKLFSEIVDDIHLEDYLVVCQKEVYN